MYACDFAVVIRAENIEELQGGMDDWNQLFQKYVLKMSLENTETTQDGKQRDKHHPEIENLKQVRILVCW